MPNYSGEPLNILHTFDMDRLYPIIRFDFDLKGELVKRRLIESLQQIADFFPEIMCSYDIDKNVWKENNYKVSDIVFGNANNVEDRIKKFDLLSGPQIRLFINKIDSNSTHFIVLLSHILTDGAGAKQIVSLLSKLYSHKIKKTSDLKNEIDIKALLKFIESKSNKLSDSLDRIKVFKEINLPIFSEKNTIYRRIGNVSLSNRETTDIKNSLHKSKVTFNDAFLAAYILVLVRYSRMRDSNLSLSCPVDLRKYLPDLPDNISSIANLTGRYLVNIHISKEKEYFDDLLEKVNQSMTKNKSTFAFTKSISTLLKEFDELSIPELRKIAMKNYNVRKISYTNFGVTNGIEFSGCEITNLAMTGGMRKWPAFQVCFNTFLNKTSFSFALEGNQEEYKFAMKLLGEIRQALLAWSLN